MTEYVLGLDISLAGTGMVLVPRKWEFNWSRVSVRHAGYKLARTATEGERVERLVHIERKLDEFVSGCSIAQAVIEQYAFGANSHAHAIGEIGGVVRRFLHKRGIPFESVHSASARTLLGKAPRKDVKVWAATRLYAAGAPHAWTLDECDAFICANWLLSGTGGDAIVMRAA